MQVVDIVVACVAVLVILALIGVLARQRYMLRAAGSLPLAVQVRGDRWVYGIARYVGGELRFYRAIGLGTRPTRTLLRSQMRILSHRRPHESELSSLPANAVVVECSTGTGGATFALADDAYTGFISWLEASAPRS